MGFFLRFVGVCVFCGLIAWFAVVGLVGPANGRRAIRTQETVEGPASRASPRPSPTSFPRLPLYGRGFLDDDSGYSLGYLWTAPIKDRSSLAECVEACRGRSQRGIASLRRELAPYSKPGPLTPDESMEKCKIESRIALLHMYEGDFVEADRWIEKAVASAGAPGLPPDLEANFIALRGVAALRRGETENCVACLGPSSCIFPLRPEAVHANPRGSRAAVDYFTDYLRRRPSDLGVRWLLNVAEMTLGAYPDRVPPEFLLPLDSFASRDDVGRFENVAALVGLDQRGPNMAGGSLFDDFTGDGLPDIVTTTGDWEMGASFFVNRGDGTFEDRSKPSGLDAQVMAANASHADFDNDGRPDLVLVRGNWEHPYRLSLMRNVGEGRFEDVTLAAGLGRPIASASAVWGDYDNDGDVDLFACGEYSPFGDDASAAHDPKRLGAVAENFCRLYRNNGDGTFTDVAESAGVTNQRWAKGATWGDFDDDGRLDLYVSNFRGPNRLYHNNGDGSFDDVAPKLGVTEPTDSFACWSWDFDNDGKLDLFVNGFRTVLDDFAGGAYGLKENRSERPRLFRNLGAGGFQDVTIEAGLDRAFLTMGANFADVDNDGFLDMYLATGKPGYSMLIPNVLLKNVGGNHFVDVTTSSGTGHLQKGHGVSFADWDRDGDLDLFVEAGGAAPGDKAHNLLFRNPGLKRHWLEIRLAGTRSNRSAIGAKVRVDIAAEPGRPARSIHRVVGGNSSFGGNSLALWFGLGDHAGPVSVKVDWPTTRSTQAFDVGPDRAIEIKEGADSFRTLDAAPHSGPSIPIRSGPSVNGTPEVQ
jgi:hypothetical protein